MRLPKIMPQDLADLKFCGKTYFLSDIKKEFYKLKTAILEKYAMPFGYALQTWYDYDNWHEDYNGNPEIFAEHNHILRRYFLSTQDGKYISEEFHVPTNEYDYWDQNQISKTSDNFFELKKQVNQTFTGTKRYSYKNEDEILALESFDRLKKKFGKLLAE